MEKQRTEPGLHAPEGDMMGGPPLAELMSKVAHELRSPLTSIHGFSSTLIKRWDQFSDEQKLQLVETIFADAQRMARIVSEVLDLARAESGRLEINRSWLDLREVLEQSIEQVAHLPGNERVVLRVGRGTPVHGDPDRLSHVFRNLLENAIKFSDEDEILVSGRTYEGQVEVAIKDHGIGIAADRIEAIFSGPGPTGQKATPSGMGLGLYLAKALVGAHGGSIGVVSEPGEGAEFTVSLPLPPDD